MIKCKYKNIIKTTFAPISYKKLLSVVNREKMLCTWLGSVAQLMDQ